MNVFFCLLFKKCTIKQLLNSVFAWYHELSKPRVCIICLSLRLRQITQTSVLIIHDIMATSSNNCLLLFIQIFCRFDWLHSPSQFFMTNWRLPYLEGRSCIMVSTRGNLRSKRFRASSSKLGLRATIALATRSSNHYGLLLSRNNSMRNACNTGKKRVLLGNSERKKHGVHGYPKTK